MIVIRPGAGRGASQGRPAATWRYLGGAGKLLAGMPEFRAGQIEQWNKPVKYDTDLFLPLPMQSLQGALQALRHYLDRKRGGVQGELLRNLLAVMPEISLDSPRSPYLPITPRTRRLRFDETD